MNQLRIMIAVLCLLLLSLVVLSATMWAEGGRDSTAVRTEYALDIAPVWAGHQVGFCLLTAGEHQFVAFYDDERRMTVASRRLDARKWLFRRLPSDVGWDSHNYITMAADDAGCIHLAGNMHVAPLTYFRTANPYDIQSFERVTAMVGENEERCTYPRFSSTPDNRLLFAYRDGKSGNGADIYNVYDLPSRTWSRLLDTPLLSGEGKMNAYALGPTRGPDDYYHLVWVWRDTPDCATNHDISYARTKDLVHWETSAGEPVTLPITIVKGEVVDPVPPGGGAINGNVRLGFDSKRRPVISYLKYDDDGNTQAFNALREDDSWHIYRTSDWDYRWDFSGGGSIPFEVRIGGVKPAPGGGLSQSYSHAKVGSGTWRLDEKTFKPCGVIETPPSHPPELGKPLSAFEGIQVQWCGDLGGSDEPGARYMLRWETLGAKRDRPREGPTPAPSMLRLYKFVQGDM